MTLCAIRLAATSALVATDSLSYDQDGGVQYDALGRPCVLSKLDIFSHAGFVVLVRGSSLLAEWLYGDLYRLRDLDTAINRLPLFLRHAGQVLDLSKAKGSPSPGNAVNIVGYSSSRGYMVRAFARSDEAFQDGADVSVYGSANPHEFRGSFDPLREGSAWPCGDATDFVAFVRQQVAHERENNPAAAYGGELVLVEITRDSMTITRPCDLGLPSGRSHIKDASQ